MGDKIKWRDAKALRAEIAALRAENTELRLELQKVTNKALDWRAQVGELSDTIRAMKGKP